MEDKALGSILSTKKVTSNSRPWAPVLIVEGEPKGLLISCISEY